MCADCAARVPAGPSHFGRPVSRAAPRDAGGMPAAATKAQKKPLAVARNRGMRSSPGAFSSAVNGEDGATEGGPRAARRRVVYRRAAAYNAGVAAAARR